MRHASTVQMSTQKWLPAWFLHKMKRGIALSCLRYIPAKTKDSKAARESSWGWDWHGTSNLRVLHLVSRVENHRVFQKPTNYVNVQFQCIHPSACLKRNLSHLYLCPLLPPTPGESTHSTRSTYPMIWNLLPQFPPPLLLEKASTDLFASWAGK